MQRLGEHRFRDKGRASWPSPQPQLAAEEVGRTEEPGPELLDMEDLRPPGTTPRGTSSRTPLAARDAPDCVGLTDGGRPASGRTFGGWLAGQRTTIDAEAA